MNIIIRYFVLTLNNLYISNTANTFFVECHDYQLLLI
jgi:hypothetical protein